MDNDVLTRLEKQMEGNGLALAAVAEVLQKMDVRLSKAEEEEKEEDKDKEEKALMNAAEMEKQMLVKAIADEVVGIMKNDMGESPYGMEVDGEHVRHGDSSASTEGDSDEDDSSETTTVDTDTGNVQGIIEAMQKQLNLLKEGPAAFMAEEERRDPVFEEDEDDEEDEETFGGPANMQYMKKSMKKLQKQINGLADGMAASVKAESENRLRKMGFKEENSLLAPQIKRYDAFGTDGTMPISKAASTGDVVDQLTELSWKQLREMQLAVESGQTDGIPKELL